MSEVKQYQYGSREVSQKTHVEDSQSLKGGSLQRGVVLQYVRMVHLGKNIVEMGGDGPGKGAAANMLPSFLVDPRPCT